MLFVLINRKSAAASFVCLHEMQLHKRFKDMLALNVFLPMGIVLKQMKHQIGFRDEGVERQKSSDFHSLEAMWKKALPS